MSDDKLLAARAVIEQERVHRQKKAAEELGAFIKNLARRYNVRVALGIDCVMIAPEVYGQRAFWTVTANDALDK